MSNDYSHLPHISCRDELALYELIPSVVWIFDLDRHGWWWGNQPALKFWGLNSIEELIAKDLSGDTQGARDRTRQTFELAARKGLSIDPWTTYPNGVPKTLHMMHRAVLVGPQRHRAIIAYINEEVDLGAEPENLLLVEAMRYTQVLVTCYSLDGEPVVENPAATAAYGRIDGKRLPAGLSVFSARFADPAEGDACLQKALVEKGGRWDYLMRTDNGIRSHTLDIRMTRHPLHGDFMLLVTEYDVTPLHEALNTARKAQEELRHLAHYDTLTGLPNLRLFQEKAAVLLAQAQRHQRTLALMFIDLDGFKAVNDRFGHGAGDRVLQEVARRLIHSVRESDQVARISGDEFILLQTDVMSKDAVINMAGKIIDSLADPIFVTDTEQARIGASIGIACYPEHGGGLESLLKAADQSMYRVKNNGKCNYAFAN